MATDSEATEVMRKRKRAGNYSAADKDLLVDLVGKYGDVVECKMTDGASMKQEEAWSAIANEFNSQALIMRDPKALKTV